MNTEILHTADQLLLSFLMTFRKEMTVHGKPQVPSPDDKCKNIHQKLKKYRYKSLKKPDKNKEKYVNAE